MSWTLFRPTDDDLHWHVVPDFGRKHDLDVLVCWCGPESDHERPEVLIHHEEH